VAQQKILPLRQVAKEIGIDLTKLLALSQSRARLNVFMQGLKTRDTFTDTDLVRVFGQEAAEAIKKELSGMPKTVKVSNLGKTFRVIHGDRLKSMLGARLAEMGKSVATISRALIKTIARLAAIGTLLADLVATGSLDEARVQWEEQQVLKAYLRELLRSIETVQGEANRYREYLGAIGEDPVSATCWAQMGLSLASAKLLDGALGLELESSDPDFPAIANPFLERIVKRLNTRDSEVRVRVEGTQPMDRTGRTSVSVVVESRRDGPWTSENLEVEDPYLYVLAQSVDQIGKTYRALKELYDERQDKLEKFWGSPFGLDYWWVKFGLAWENLVRMKGDIADLWDYVPPADQQKDFAENIKKEYLGGR